MLELTAATTSFVTADDLHDAFCGLGHQCRMDDLCQVRESARHVADALSIRAADIRARALEDAAEDLFYDGDTDQPLPGYTALLERAESERSAS